MPHTMAAPAITNTTTTSMMTMSKIGEKRRLQLSKAASKDEVDESVVAASGEVDVSTISWREMQMQDRVRGAARLPFVKITSFEDEEEDEGDETSVRDG